MVEKNGKKSSKLLSFLGRSDVCVCFFFLVQFLSHVMFVSVCLSLLCFVFFFPVFALRVMHNLLL